MSVRRSFELVRGQMIRASLAQIPLARVKDVTAGRLRLGALESNGFATIQQVLDTPPSRLTLVQGVGEQTAQQVFAAARQLRRRLRTTCVSGSTSTRQMETQPPWCRRFTSGTN